MDRMREQAQRVPRRLLRNWVVNEFHRRWYESNYTWKRNRFLGYTIKQLPFDIWLYQELIHELRPSFIVQTGVSEGGSVLFFAHVLDMIGAPSSARVVGVDIKLTDSARTLSHPRLHLIESSSVTPECLERVRGLIEPGVGLVSLDSDHSCAHVAKELELYSSLLTRGSYLVVEDTNVNGHPVSRSFGPGPFEATRAFLARHEEFEADDARWQRNLISFHHHGWLRKAR
jgi:cephalosporin hydroxylase